MKKTLAMVALLAVGAAMVSTSHAQAAATTPVVRWDLNEASATHRDSISGLVATSGSDVQNRNVYAGATGINMPSTTTERRLHEVMPQRLTTSPTNPILDPGSGQWAIEVRAAWTRGYGNLIQKGQSASKGGYYKIELPSGRVACVLKDGNLKQFGVKSPLRYDDGKWHTIRCERNADRIRLLVDGVVVRQVVGTLAKIQNGVQLTIAGKASCNQVTVTCDYYDGRIDYVTIFR